MKTTVEPKVLTSTVNMPVIQGFYALEALQETSREAGWDCEYSQMEAGNLESRIGLIQIDDLMLGRELANKKLEFRGSTPEQFISVLVPGLGTEVKFNGFSLHDEQLMILPPSSELSCMTQAQLDVSTIHIHDDTLSFYLRDLLPETDPSAIFKDAPFTSSATNIDRMRNLLHMTMQDNNTTYSTGEFQDNLMIRLIRIIEASKKDPIVRNRYNRSQKRILLVRAVEYIESNLTDSFSVRDLCAYVGVSLSTLERLFLRELQLLPGQYLRMRRLNAVRRDIYRFGEHDTVSKTAISNGFMHMGRFSAAYRTHFGSLPRDDVRSIIKK